jgi:hypothetical protein
MAVSEGLITKAVVEIKYDRGVVYLDHCGSLMLKVQDVVGSNFRASLPGMEFAQLDNVLERIVVIFGRKAMRVEQTGPASGARIEKLTSDCWDCVAETLGVRSHVERFGVRLFNIWPTTDVDEARRLITASGLVDEGARWQEAFGVPAYAAYTATTLTERGRIRRCLDEVEHIIEGMFPEGFAQYLPRAGIQYDVDYVFARDSAQFGLKREQARDFVRSSWNSFQQDRAKVAGALAIRSVVQ